MTVLEHLKSASSPEDVFGKLAGGKDDQMAEAKRIFRRLALAIHPDHHTGADKDEANEAMALLNRWWDETRRQIEAGEYGQKLTVLAVGGKTIRVGRRIRVGSVCNDYHCTIDGDNRPLIFRTVRSPRDNDLVEAEVQTIQKLRTSKHHDFYPYIPETILSCRATFGATTRQGMVLTYREGFYSIEEVMRAHSALDPRDVAWMYKRLLAALGFAHAEGRVFGAVLPSHVYLHPGDHGLLLADWHFSVQVGRPLRAIDAAYESWYPPEVASKGEVGSWTDLFMAARCGIYLLGGTPARLSSSVPRSIQNFLRASLIPNPFRRPADAWELHEEFDSLLLSLYGPRKWRPLRMPT